MKIGWLKKRLEGYPDDTEVLVADSPFASLDIVSIYQHPETGVVWLDVEPREKE